jgi:hypothetical protein
MVSVAKRGGGVQALLINGDPQQSPWYLVTAISHALTVLSWFELPEDDQPPEHIWSDAEAVNDHFTMVRERHKNPGLESIPEGGEMMQNALTADLKRRR